MLTRCLLALAFVQFIADTNNIYKIFIGPFTILAQKAKNYYCLIPAAVLIFFFVKSLPK